MMKHLRTLFVLSLLLNVFLVSIICGQLSYSMYSPRGVQTLPADPMAKLSETKHKLYADALQKAWQDMQATHAQIIAGKQEALRLLTAEHFNETAYLAEIRHLEDLHLQMKQHLAAVVVKLAQQSTKEERAVLAEEISHPSPPPMPPQQCGRHPTKHPPAANP